MAPNDAGIGTALEDQSVVSLGGLKSPHVAGAVSLNLETRENDTRAKQFSCGLRIHNGFHHPIDVLGINYRLASGLALETTTEASFADLKTEYDRLVEDVRYIMRSILISTSENYRNEFMEKFIASLRNLFRVRNIMMAYLYIVTRRLRIIGQNYAADIQRMDFPITSAERALSVFDTLNDQKIVPPSVTALLKSKIDRMREIEGINRNFIRPEYIAQVLPGEDFDREYVLKAKRHFSAIATYTVAFDVKIGWKDRAGDDANRAGDDANYYAERIISRSDSLNVTPSPITLSLMAVAFGLLGTTLNVVNKLEGYGQIITWEMVKKYFVGSVVAVVVFNSIEMTEFKDKMPRISWRAAMFIGLLCGLFSERMLKAITSFVQ